MNQERLMVIWSVLEGKLPENYTSDEEMQEFGEYLMDAAAEKVNPCLPHYTYGIQ